MILSSGHGVEIVCLCGSTRFKDEFARQNARLTLEGRIVVLPGFFGREPGDDKPDDFPVVSEGDKRALDELHFRKIELADRVLVLNVGGYIGRSTAREIGYAEGVDVPVDYLEPQT